MLKEQAEILDAQERPVEAADAYEKAIAGPDADLETFLNLAVLYMVCNDGGYAAHHRLSREFLSTAWNRAFQLLDEAESRFGPNSEISFWRYYFRFFLLGEDPFYEKCEQLVHSGSSLVPYFYVFGYTGKERYRTQAQQLFEIVKDGSTEKKRFIRSILENRVNANEIMKS